MSFRCDATGVLLFEGPARVTPVIRLLFTPFNLEPLRGDCREQCYIEVLDGSPSRHWYSYVDQLIQLLPESTRADLPMYKDPASVLLSIGRRYGVDLHEFVDGFTFSTLEICDVVRLAKLMRDGHNLVGLSMEGAGYSDGAFLGAFRGWATFASPRYCIHLSSSDVLHLAHSLDITLPDVPDAAVDILDEWLIRFIDGIADDAMRRTLRARYGLSDVQESSSATADAAPAPIASSIAESRPNSFSAATATRREPIATGCSVI